MVRSVVVLCALITASLSSGCGYFMQRDADIVGTYGRSSYVSDGEDELPSKYEEYTVEVEKSSIPNQYDVSIYATYRTRTPQGECSTTISAPIKNGRISKDGVTIYKDDDNLVIEVEDEVADRICLFGWNLLKHEVLKKEK